MLKHFRTFQCSAASTKLGRRLPGVFPERGGKTECIPETEHFRYFLEGELPVANQLAGSLHSLPDQVLRRRNMQLGAEQTIRPDPADARLLHRPGDIHAVAALRLDQRHCAAEPRRQFRWRSCRRPESRLNLIDEILYGQENPFDIDCGCRLTRLMEGGCKALEEKRTVMF